MDHPLLDNFQDNAQVDICKQRYGILVNHYWHNNSQVKLTDIDQGFNNIQLSLNAFSLYPTYEDKMIWNADPSGQFKVSTLFVSREKGNQPFWSQAWIKGLIPKINIFYWIMLQNKILTQDNFQKRGINVVNRCTLCKNRFGDRDHLFLNCSYSEQVWTEILNYWSMTWVHQNNVKLFFKSWKCPSKDPDVELL